MKMRWPKIWFLGGFLPLFLVLWLAWVLPDFGFFRLETGSFDLPQDGMVLVERIAGKAVSSEALASYGTGWQALGEMWPLMLFCSMAGYCLGFGYHSLYYFLAIEQAPAGEKTSEKKKITDLVENEWNSPWIQEIEVKKLRALLQQANSELFAQKVSAGECKKQAGVLARKTESLQRDLFNARAKIRRLETKQRRRSVDQSPMSEYNDDM